MNKENLNPIIKTFSEKKLIGQKISTNLLENKTKELWQKFMPLRNTITNAINTDLISMQVFDVSFTLKDFDAKTQFEKWATVEVGDFSTVPNQMECFVLPHGLYAVFNYIGLSMDTKIFEYIYGVWLPNSNYELDNRPHFEILGSNYKNGDPNSEEEICIPIKLKTI